jgi:hypothetical protein
MHFLVGGASAAMPLIFSPAKPRSPPKISKLKPLPQGIEVFQRNAFLCGRGFSRDALDL